MPKSHFINCKKAIFYAIFDNQSLIIIGWITDYSTLLMPNLWQISRKKSPYPQLLSKNIQSSKLRHFLAFYTQSWR